jgi:hypothetical protein
MVNEKTVEAPIIEISRNGGVLPGADRSSPPTLENVDEQIIFLEEWINALRGRIDTDATDAEIDSISIPTLQEGITNFRNRYTEIEQIENVDSQAEQLAELDKDIQLFSENLVDKANKAIETINSTMRAGRRLRKRGQESRRRSSSARKSSSRRGRRSAKKRGTQRKQKRRQRRGSRRAY